MRIVVCMNCGLDITTPKPIQAVVQSAVSNIEVYRESGDVCSERCLTVVAARAYRKAEDEAAK